MGCFGAESRICPLLPQASLGQEGSSFPQSWTLPLLAGTAGERLLCSGQSPQRGARGFSAHLVSSGLSLAPLRLLLQAAGEEEAEDEEGAVTLSTQQAFSCHWKGSSRAPLAPPAPSPPGWACCVRSLAAQGSAIPGAIPRECARLAVPSQEGLAGGPGWDTR